MPNPEDFEDILEKVLGKILGQNVSDPTSDNPEDYERAIEITDGDALMMLEKLHHLRRSGDRKIAELRIYKSDYDSLRARFFLHLEDLYPHIATAQQCEGSGWRQWRGKYYYVGWDKKEKSKNT